jgi:hypothetical protein
VSPWDGVAFPWCATSGGSHGPRSWRYRDGSALRPLSLRNTATIALKPQATRNGKRFLTDLPTIGD